MLGETLNTENAMQIIQNINNDRTENALASICDDLSFSMYVEESIVETIREIEAKKTKAVNGKLKIKRFKSWVTQNTFFSDERFEYARKLKLCMGALRTAGERLGRYSLAKRQAVQQEDFIAARLRKEQIEIYKKLVYERLQVSTLLELNGLCAENDCVSDVYAQKPSLPSPPSLQDVASSLSNDSTLTAAFSPIAVHRDVSTTELKSPKSPNKLHELRQSPQLGCSPKRGSPNTGSFRRRNKSAPRSSYEDYEERAIPTLRQ